MKIRLTSHGAVISDYYHSATARMALRRYLERLVEYEVVKEGSRTFNRPFRTWCGATADRKEVRIHRNQVQELVEFLNRNGVSQSEIEVTATPFDVKALPEVIFTPRKEMVPLPNQVPIIFDYALLDDHSAKLITLQTGGGKTFISEFVMMCRKRRTLIMMKSSYITDRWIPDFEKMFIWGRDDILHIDSGEMLSRVMRQALSGRLPDYSVMFMSFSLMRMYIADYEANNGPSEKYPIPPDEFCEELGIGFRITDEAHQEYYLNHRINLYLNVPNSLGLSATMRSDKPFLDRMYTIAYPHNLRNDGGGINKYIRAVAWMYSFGHVKRQVNFRGPRGYSHSKFEDSLKRNAAWLDNYFKMIDDCYDKLFTPIYQPGMRSLLLFTRIWMCEKAVSHMSVRHRGLKAAKYTSGDPVTALEADIICSTPGSAGTAVDIPDLIFTMMTTAMDSSQACVQALGRLRVPKNFPGVTPIFAYFVCESVPAHVKYDENKRKYFHGKVLDHCTRTSSVRISGN